MGSSFHEAKDLSTLTKSLPPQQGIDLLKILSQDLKSSLVSMSAILNTLNSTQPAKDDNHVGTKLEELIDKMGNLSSMLEESLYVLLALEEKNLHEQTLIDFKRDIIEPVLLEFDSKVAERQLTVESPSDKLAGFFIPTKTDKSILKMVFRNLFSNTIRYSELNETITISIKYGSPFCLLKICNSGRPIAEGLSEELFSIHLPPQYREEIHHHGVGLGLHLAKRVMQMLGGEIWYEPEEQGMCIVIAIPVETKQRLNRE